MTRETRIFAIALAAFVGGAIGVSASIVGRSPSAATMMEAVACAFCAFLLIRRRTECAR